MRLRNRQMANAKWQLRRLKIETEIEIGIEMEMEIVRLPQVSVATFEQTHKLRLLASELRSTCHLVASFASIPFVASAAAAGLASFAKIESQAALEFRLKLKELGLRNSCTNKAADRSQQQQQQQQH